MRSKVYVVVEFGGFYEDAWEHTIGVCSTSELADKLKAQIEEEHDPSNCVISEEDWESISDRLYEAEESGYEYEDTVSGIKGLFPPGIILFRCRSMAARRRKGKFFPLLALHPWNPLRYPVR